MTKIERLIASGQSVFNTQDLAVLWAIPHRRRLLEDIKYYLRASRLVRLHRGIYTLPDVASKYPVFELSQKLVPMSYISLSTALSVHGISFQYDETVHAVALFSKKYIVSGRKIQYHQVKEVIFFEQTGLLKKDKYVLASPERAVCDTLYFFPNYGIDNLRGLDRDRLVLILPIYKNRRLEKHILGLIKKME